MARAWLDREARDRVVALAGLTDPELDEIRDEVTGLPALDLSLHVSLPRLLSPALERLRWAIARGDRDATVSAGPAAVAEIDTPNRRADLGRAVLALPDRGHLIARDVVAYAIVDLAENRRSALLTAALGQTLAVAAGAIHTPSGLVLAAT